jgi:peptidoglycan/LPS O-acetylase OafA/YrhL
MPKNIFWIAVISAAALQLVLLVLAPPIDQFFRMLAAGLLLLFGASTGYSLFVRRGGPQTSNVRKVWLASFASVLLGTILLTPYGMMDGAWTIVRISLLLTLIASMVTHSGSNTDSHQS